MNWLYPEEGQTWEEGEEIVAEFSYYETRYNYRMKRICRDGRRGWIRHNCTSKYWDDDPVFELIAYMPYVKPTPPEKPQDCPFCGRKVKLCGRIGQFWYECRILCFRFPEGKTKAEAIKALNSVRVVTEE